MKLGLSLYVQYNSASFLKFASEWSSEDVDFSQKFNSKQFMLDVIGVCLWKNLSDSFPQELPQSTVDFCWHLYHAQAKILFGAFAVDPQNGCMHRRRSFSPPEYLTILSYLRLVREASLDIDTTIDMTLAAMISAVDGSDYAACVLIHDFLEDLSDRDSDDDYVLFVKFVLRLLRSHASRLQPNIDGSKRRLFDFDFVDFAPGTLRDEMWQAIESLSAKTESTDVDKFWKTMKKLNIV